MSNVPTLTVARGVEAPRRDDLTDCARGYARASKSANTRRAYAVQFRQWQAYAEAAGCAAMPSNPIHVANWLAARAAQGKAYATLTTGLAGVRAANVAAGYTFDTRHPAIECVLRGIARENARPPQQAQALRATDIANLLAKLTPAAIDQRDGALLALGFMFAARASELSGLDYQTLGDGDGFVALMPDRISMTLVRSKTGRRNEPQRVAVGRSAAAKLVKAIETWVAIAAPRPGQALLRSVHKNGAISSTRLTSGSVSRIIKRRLIEHDWRTGGNVSVPRESLHPQAGLPAPGEPDGRGRYSSHSLRVGAAVTAAENGADPRQIAHLGRWRSLQMAARYCEQAEDLAANGFHLSTWGAERR